MLKAQEIYLSYLDAVKQLIVDTPLSADALEELSQDVQKTELLIPIIGAFSAGKSSLINSLLGEDILGVGLSPETELATEIRYSSDPHLLALRADGNSEKLEISELKLMKSRASEFTHLQLYLDNQALKLFPSLVLVDMPGFGSSLANHNKAISYYLPRGAHFVVVTSVEDGNITQSMLRQLDDLQTYGRNFTFLLNKVNLKSEKDAQDVADLVNEQIQGNFSSAPVTMVGNDGGERLKEALIALQPEKIMQTIFEDRLKDFTHLLLSQINLSTNALKKDRAENEHALSDLTKAIRQIECRRDDALDDLRDNQLDHMVDHCLKVVGRELDNAEAELVNAGLSGNQESFSRIVSEIVRSSMSRSVKDQMDIISRSIVDDFAQAIGDLGKNIGQVDNEQNWLGELTDRLNRGLQKTGETLGHWSGSLAERNTQELERLKKEKDWKEGQPLPRVSYQALTTVLAVTTSIVNPVIELAIIFLPTILSYINEGRQRDALRQKIINETIPSVKRELRDRLPSLLNEQMSILIEQVSGEFEREIGEKQRLIAELSNDYQQNAQAAEQKMERLVYIRDTLQKLATDTLYGEKV